MHSKKSPICISQNFKNDVTKSNLVLVLKQILRIKGSVPLFQQPQNTPIGK